LFDFSNNGNGFCVVFEQSVCAYFKTYNEKTQQDISIP